MKTDELLTLGGNPNFIEGIYNYCDRWCERCTMTHRCLLYASTPNDEEAEQGLSENLAHEMMRQIEQSFELTIDLLNRIATENGIDLEKTTETEESLNEHERIRKEIQKSPLCRLAKEYLDATHQWLEDTDDTSKAKDEELQQAQLLQLPGRNPEQEIVEIKNALDVVHWYYFQINVKLARAQSSRIRNRDWDDEEAEPMQKDSDGSAKVALIGIERSIGALGILLQHLPDQEESILHLLSILDRLRNMTDAEFPEARKFYRKGLDANE